MTAAATAATRALNGEQFVSKQKLVLPNQKTFIEVEVHSAAKFSSSEKALAINHSYSGLSLDVTNGLEIWVIVSWSEKNPNQDINKDLNSGDRWLLVSPGLGVGRSSHNHEICMSDFARNLLCINLRPLIPKDKFLHIEIVFPNGKNLAKRTSNEAFGVVEGLALIGNQAEAQVSASPNQVQDALQKLQKIVGSEFYKGNLIHVIGENGLDLAIKNGFPSNLLLKVGNWIGPLLVASAKEGVKNLLIFGYHGKLIKLAGGIFHTHHHLADARIEILISLAVREKIPISIINEFASASTIEDAFERLRQKDHQMAEKLWISMASVVEQRCNEYISRYGSWKIKVGCALFDKKRAIRWTGPIGSKQLDMYSISLKA